MLVARAFVFVSCSCAHCDSFFPFPLPAVSHSNYQFPLVSFHLVLSFVVAYLASFLHISPLIPSFPASLPIAFPSYQTSPPVLLHCCLLCAFHSSPFTPAIPTIFSCARLSLFLLHRLSPSLPPFLLLRCPLPLLSPPSCHPSFLSPASFPSLHPSSVPVFGIIISALSPFGGFLGPPRFLVLSLVSSHTLFAPFLCKK